MIVFVNHDGSIALQSVSTINQGSVDANKIVLVGPFSNSIVTIAFTLPNGIVLGPNLADLPEEYTMTNLNDGGAVYTGLYAYSYTMNKSLTSMAGTLGIQFFISTNRGTEENPTYTDTLATNMVNVTVYNGSRYIPPLEVPSSSDELTKLLSAIESALANAIKSDSGGESQSIYSDVDIKVNPKGNFKGGNLGVAGDLVVSNHSTLGLTAKVVNDDGVATIEFDGDTGEVNITDGKGGSSIKPQEASFAGNVDVGNNLTVTGKLNAGSLDVGGVSTLGSITKAVKADGTPTVTIYGDTGLVSANSVSTNAANTNKLVTNQIVSSIADQIDIFHEFLGKYKTTLNLYGSLVVSDNIDVSGNLNVKGTTINQTQESILVRDNIIVTNSSGAGFSVSGIVMRLPPDENEPDAPSEAYGMLYSPADKAIMIGKGTITEIPNVTTGAVTYEFEFTEGEALPLAARDGFDGKGGYLPVWDAGKNAFVPSDKRILENGSFEGNINVNGDVTGSEASFSKVEIHDGVNGNTITPDFASFNEVRARNLVINGVDAATYVQDIVADYVANNGGGGGDTAAIAEELRKINTGGIDDG